MKKWMLSAVLVLAALSVQAQVKTVPGPVLDWYKDTMSVLVSLKTDFDAVGSAPATAAAFDKATALVRTKQLAPRYHQLKAQYPDFFHGAGNDNAAAFVPPPGWEKTLSDYSQAMMGYSQSMQKIMPYAQDPAVVKSLQAFQQAIGEISSGS